MNLVNDQLQARRSVEDELRRERVAKIMGGASLAQISGAGGFAVVDLREISSAIYRNRLLILVTIAASVLLGLAFTLAMTPIYEAKSSLQIEQQEKDVLQGDENRISIPTQDADRFLQTQLDIIQSRYLADQVARALNLYSDRAFLKAMGRDISDDEWGNRDERREAVLKALSDNLAVTLPMESRIANIGFRSPDAALAARVANSFAENAIKANLQRKLDQSSYARDYLQRQLDQARVRLEQSERALVGYARSAGIIDTSAGANSGRSGDNQATGPHSITTATLIQLNSELASATADRVAAEARWREAASSSALTLPQTLSNQAVQNLMGARAQAEADYQKQRQAHREDYPDVLQAAAKVAELDREIGTIGSRIRSSVKNDYDAALRRETDLAARVESLKSINLAEQDKSVSYNILRRNADTNRSMYESLLQRYREVSAEAGVTASNVTLLDRADVPLKPVLPKPFLNLALAGLVGLMLSALLTFIRERFDDVIRSPADVEDKLGLHSLGAIPVSEHPLADLSDPKSEVSEALHTIRTALELSTSAGVPNSLTFTSSQPAEGKSTTALAVARNLALLGRRVILLDVDLRKPNVHRLVELKNEWGLSDLLAGRKNLDQVINSQVFSGLDVVTAGPTPPSPTELLGGDQWHTLLPELNRRYDVAIFDCPPVMGLADAPLLAAKLAATIFVIEANKAHGGRAKIALRRLADARANLIGSVLTKFDARKLGYKDYEAYGYSYAYGSPAE